MGLTRYIYIYKRSYKLYIKFGYCAYITFFLKKCIYGFVSKEGKWVDITARIERCQQQGKEFGSKEKNSAARKRI